MFKKKDPFLFKGSHFEALHNNVQWNDQQYTLCAINFHVFTKKSTNKHFTFFFCMSLDYFTVWNTGRYALCTSILENMASPFINIEHFEFINKVWGYYQRMKYSKHDLKISTVPEPSKQHCISAMITQCQRRSTQSNTDFLSCKCP